MELVFRILEPQEEACLQQLSSQAMEDLAREILGIRRYQVLD